MKHKQTYRQNRIVDAGAGGGGAVAGRTESLGLADADYIEGINNKVLLYHRNYIQ